MVWSVSLDRAWSRCQRQYFFHKMASSTASDDQRNRAQQLKDVMSPEIWRGKVVHKIIETKILPKLKGRDACWPEADPVVEAAITLAQRQYAFSKNKRYEQFSKKQAGNDYGILEPHYFGIEEDADFFNDSIKVITQAVNNLLNSEQMRAFLMGRFQYRVENTFHFNVGESSIRAVPDLVMPNKKRGGLDIVDWKLASSSDPYNFQIAVYALAVKASDWLFQLAPRDPYGYVINLLESEPAVALKDPYKFDEDVLNETVDMIFEKVERIEALVRGRKFAQLNINDFDFARSIGTCALCNWKSMCVELSNGSPAKFLSDHQSEPTQPQLPNF